VTRAVSTRLTEMIDRHSRVALSPQDAGDMARASLECEREADAIPILSEVLDQNRTDPILWQWRALLNRALDRRDLAIPDFEKATLLAPNDAGIAHGYTRVVMEAGLSAVALFDRALALAPGNGEIILGRTAALLAEGQGSSALDDLDAILRQHPDWLAGHRDRIQLAWLLGHGDASFDAFKYALQTRPKDADLWHVGISALSDAGRSELALGSIRNARKFLGDLPYLDLNEAIILSELGRVDEADRVFEAVPSHDDPALAVHMVRHALRNGRVEDAVARIDRVIASQGGEALWPYADIAWRLSGDVRYDWLIRSDDLVKVVDLEDRLPDLGRLSEILRGLHKSQHEHLDQSVRGGTQTDGVLFSRIEPEIMALRAVIAEAVSVYVANLPGSDPRHPILGVRRDFVPRFSGSWSVKLSGKGHHANHIHPAGIISSALYVSLPELARGQGDHEGWLQVGAPQSELGLNLPPTRYIEPKPGRLVLFPSTHWHGTVPFDAGERLTVAFDVAPPKVQV
jgi:tetratricopeptide (TPR) repeat protein